MASKRTAAAEAAPTAGSDSATRKRTCLQVPQRRFVSVGYPGYVEAGVANALTTLGGIRGISAVWADSTRRMELRFRLADTVSHPLTADREPCTAVLLKVTPYAGGETDTSAASSVDSFGTTTAVGASCSKDTAAYHAGCEASIVGLVDHEYNFTGGQDNAAHY